MQFFRIIIIYRSMTSKKFYLLDVINDSITFDMFILWDNLMKSFYHPMKFHLNQH